MIRYLLLRWPCRRLASFYDWLRGRLFVARNDAAAFVLFEALNEGGADLTVADLVMSYLLYLSGEHIVTTQERWADMVRTLDNGSDADVVTPYLCDFWSSRYGFVRERDLYRQMTRRIRSAQAAQELVQALAKHAAIARHCPD